MKLKGRVFIQLKLDMNINSEGINNTEYLYTSKYIKINIYPKTKAFSLSHSIYCPSNHDTIYIVLYLSSTPFTITQKSASPAFSLSQNQ